MSEIAPPTLTFVIGDRSSDLSQEEVSAARCIQFRRSRAKERYGRGEVIIRDIDFAGVEQIQIAQDIRLDFVRCSNLPARISGKNSHFYMEECKNSPISSEWDVYAVVLKGVRDRLLHIPLLKTTLYVERCHFTEICVVDGGQQHLILRGNATFNALSANRLDKITMQGSSAWDRLWCDIDLENVNAFNAEECRIQNFRLRNQNSRNARVVFVGTKFHENGVRSLPHLDSVHFENTRGLKSLTLTEPVESLKLENNNLETLEVAQVRALDIREENYLSSIKAKKIEIASISGCRHLKDLEADSIDDFTINYAAKLTTLEGIKKTRHFAISRTGVAPIHYKEHSLYRVGGALFIFNGNDGRFRTVSNTRDPNLLYKGKLRRKIALFCEAHSK